MSTTAVDLTDIAAAAGTTIFSYLPMGSLLNGLSSPMLVSKTFRGAILECLREETCFSFSQCSHLRKIGDDQLISLLKSILGDSCTHLKAKHLDLSKCRKLRRDGVIFCLKKMPNIQTLSLSSATRICIDESFNDPILMAAVKNLKHVDVSGCTTLKNQEICCLTLTLSGSNIRVLDFSGCSTLIGDDAALSVARHCHHSLESINVSGSKKLTTFGVAIIAHVCRGTLRCLSLRGCTLVKLTTLLYSYANAMYPVIGPVFEQELEESERLLRLCEEYEERWAGGVNRHECAMFGQLEKLDISNTFPLHPSHNPELAGVLGVIAWLNKGKLREINLSGLYIPPTVVSTLALASGAHLKCLEVSSLEVATNLRDETQAPWHSLFCIESVCEVDLSCGDALIGSNTKFSLLMENLRSLKLDHLPVTNDKIEEFLSNTKRLLHISVHGCSALKVSVLTKAKAQNPDLKLIELDVRDAVMDVPLSTIRDAYPTLLKLNNRYTKLGKERIQQHQQDYQWRFGARARANKRKRGEALSVSPVPGSSSLSLNCCSLQFTGFSKADCTEQEMFGCKTCRIEYGRFICMACSKACHIGHEIFGLGCGPGYCDCCIISDCKCISN